jgi:putative hemolysin
MKLKLWMVMMVALLLMSGCNVMVVRSADTGAPKAETTGTMVETSDAPASLANPASVYCEEQGGRLEMRSDADGNQHGVCLFEDGSECEEWAFFREECAPGGPGDDETTGNTTPKQVYGWFGIVVAPQGNRPFEDYLMLSPDENVRVALIPADDEVANTLDYLENSGRHTHVWGSLICEDEGSDSCRVEVTRLRPDGPAEDVAPDPVEGWRGTLRRMPASAQFDDVFILDDPRFPVHYGIEARDPILADQLNTLAASGEPCVISGDLACGVIDVNGCQIQVTQIEADTF